MGGAQGQATDIEIAAREIIRMQDKIRLMLAENTGQTYDKIARDTDRDYYLSSQQALEYGIVDEVLGVSSQTNAIGFEATQAADAVDDGSPSENGKTQ